jgi:hypothetical protein
MRHDQPAAPTPILHLHHLGPVQKLLMVCPAIPRRWTPPAMLNVPEARLRSRAAPSIHGLTVQFHH